MASLLERLDISTGPVRNEGKSNRSASAPYNKANRAPKGNSNDTWTHDMFEPHTSLAARLSANGNSTAKPSVNFSGVQKAMKEAVGNSSQLSIKGAASGNVVQVSGLVEGTSADDVATIFKKCGQITQSSVVENGAAGPTVRLKFSNADAAKKAVEAFNGQHADGRTLRVQIVGVEPSTTTLGGRLGGPDGLSLVRGEGSVDVLMESGSTTGSKMYSDSLTSDPRAQVLVAPPGADPAQYSQTPARGGRGRRGGGGGGGGRGRGRRGGAKMQVD